MYSANILARRQLQAGPQLVSAVSVGGRASEVEGRVASRNRAEAVRVYANCRKLFRDELGAEPSEQTAAVFLSIVRAE